MNFKFILILVLGLLIFTSQILFGFIFYKTYDEATETGKILYGKYKMFYFGNIGVLVLMAVVDGLLVLKA